MYHQQVDQCRHAVHEIAAQIHGHKFGTLAVQAICVADLRYCSYTAPRCLEQLYQRLQQPFQ